MPSSNFYAGMPLDRADALRTDTAAIKRLLRNPSCRVLPVWRHRHPIAEGGVSEVSMAAPRPVWQVGPAAHALLALGATWVLLGIADGVGHFAVDISDQDEADARSRYAAGGTFQDLRALGPLLKRNDSAVMAYARGLLFWHQRHRYCGMCGSPTLSIRGGHVRHCTNADCATDHFPRTDPAVIVLVVHEDQCLLGRQRIWPAGMHSTLAGFVEPGESLEEAVIREIYEEAGVRLAERPVYHSSQPWPFPASIMLGFHVRAESRDLTVDTGELETAAWFRQEDLRNSPEDEAFRLPRKDSIARRLIDDWLTGKVAVG